MRASRRLATFDNCRTCYSFVVLRIERVFLRDLVRVLENVR